MGAWAAGEVLGLDFETTGVDRFNDVPVSYALVYVVDGVVVRSWSGLIDPGREIPAEATAVHGISTERARAEGMPLARGHRPGADAVVSAGRRGVPLVGMKLDYDLTMLETAGRCSCAARAIGTGLARTGARRGRDRPPLRPRPRGQADARSTCAAHYGIEIAAPTRRVGGRRSRRSRCSSRWPCATEALWECDLARLHEDQIGWHRDWTHEYDGWRLSQGMVPIDPRDYVWPVAPAVLPPAA